MAVSVQGGAVAAADGGGDDPYLWLEAVDDAKALDWVRSRNAVATQELEASPDFKPIHDRLLTILDSEARIPYVTKIGDRYYNFWRDAKQVRGIWRRTTVEEYAKAEPVWETVLDLDALAAAEHENWVWKGADCRHPDYQRCLLQLSRGGGDAVVIREFDLLTRAFVSDGFVAPEAKTDITWAGPDEVYIASDFGPGSLTDSGYPRIVRKWQRGTPLADAVDVFAGAKEDVASSALVIDSGGHHHEMIRRATTFYSGENWLKVGDRFELLNVPDDAQVGFWRDQLTIELRSDWAIGGEIHPGGALLAIAVADFLAGQRAFATLYTPGPRKSLSGLAGLKSALIVNELDNVRSRLYLLKPGRDGWTRTPIEAPAFGALGVSAIDDDSSDDYWLTVTDFLTPTTLYRASLGGGAAQRLKALPPFFDAGGLDIVQHEVTSKDGTRVPYFQVSRKGLKLDGRNPTLLYGYGGFEVSMLPSYSAGVGASWLERGGVYVLANIRGGGEFGPAWHQAALKANRQRAYDDFITIAEDLAKRKVTSPKHLGIQGGSNGGLLMGVMLTQRPELFGAVVCQVPLLDMRRYHQLLAGASWMGEYGNPDIPEEWAWIAKYSPYQNLKPDTKYPRVLFTTSTRDDRVHPGHARKMAARMAQQGHDVLYYENIEGGHGGAANNPQLARMGALAYAFLWQQLK
ncbi:MAG: prolyl oligopeptidase family serine peptidase [Gammaproteobacteria bacterium]|nr:prolyl oligopeptidase family serine peptidase [Gammaproteobacteria bacterium]